MAMAATHSATAATMTARLCSANTPKNCSLVNGRPTARVVLAYFAASNRTWIASSPRLVVIDDNRDLLVFLRRHVGDRDGFAGTRLEDQDAAGEIRLVGRATRNFSCGPAERGRGLSRM